MENEINLEQAISEISHQIEPAEKTDQIKDELKRTRIEKYLQIGQYLNQLKSTNKIKPKAFDQKFDQVIDVSAKEFGEPLSILELEKSVDFSRQYASQIQCLSSLGLIYELPTAKGLGIRGVDGGEYQVPELMDIAKILEGEKGDLVKLKVSQGFDKLILVPFAVDIKALIGAYGQLLELKSDQGKLRSNNLFKRKLRVDRGSPVSLADAYSKDTILYFPECSGYEIAAGKTKIELLESQEDEQVAKPWRILMVQDRNGILHATQLQSKNGRSDIAPSYTPQGFANIIKNLDMYKGEFGFTIEDWLTLSLSKLYQENIQIDQILNMDDKNCLCLGSYLKATNAFAACNFLVENTIIELWGGANLMAYSQDDINANFSIRSSLGLRTAVQIN